MYMSMAFWLTPAYPRIWQHRQSICLRHAPGSRTCEYLDLATAVAFQIERQIHAGDQPVLEFPRTLADNPADQGVLRHPCRQDLLPCDEDPAAARPHSPQLDAQLIG
jgi:hypothetical protein